MKRIKNESDKKKIWRQTAIHSNLRKTEIMKFWMNSIEMLNIRIGVYVLYASDEAETFFSRSPNIFVYEVILYICFARPLFLRKVKFQQKIHWFYVETVHHDVLYTAYGIPSSAFNDINIFVYIILHKAQFSLFSPREND